MPAKRELSAQQIEEIQSLRGKLSIGEARRKYGIGASRLYKLWSRGANSPNIGKGVPPVEKTPFGEERTDSLGEEENSPQIYSGVPPNTESTKMEVVDPQNAYKILQEIQTALSRMEILQLENHDLAIQAVSLLEPPEDLEDLLDDLVEEEEKNHTTIPEEIEQQSTTTRNTIWYSSAAILAVFFYTIFRRKSCPPAVQQPLIPKQQKTFRDPFYME